MKRSLNLAWLAGVVFLIPLALLSCSGTSGETANGDQESELTDKSCSSDLDCISTASNLTCNTASQLCVDHGLCRSSQQCQQLYGQSLSACNSKGLCTAAGLADGDQSDQASETDLITDGDGPTDGDASCTDYIGFYDGAFNCGGSTQHYDTSVVTDYMNCTIVIDYNGQEISGTVADAAISTNSGKTCTGSGDPAVSIRLDCDDGCQITLTPKTGTGTGRLSVRPTELKFGSVFPGEVKEQAATVENMGAGDLHINKIFFLPGTPGDFAFSNPADWQTPKTMLSAASEQLKVTFAPKEEKETVGMLAILSDSSDSPVMRLKLTSERKAAPHVEVDPTAVGFGKSAPGFDNRKYFLIKNSGGAAARIVEINLDNDHDGTFILEDHPETPFNLDAAVSEAVTLNFRPKDGAKPAKAVGHATVVWLDRDQQRREIGIDLLGEITELAPACLDLQPREGRKGWMGLSDVAGPGVKFGYAQVGQPVSRAVTITNCGDLPLTVGTFTWMVGTILPIGEAPAFGEKPGSFTSYTIQRHATVSVDITFTPRNAGVLYAETFSFMTNAEVLGLPGNPKNDPNQPVLVGLYGTGATKGVQVFPSKIDFSQITLGCCSKPEEIKVYNVGKVLLTITKIEIGASSDQKFELLGVPALPVKLGGESNPQSFSFQVKFCPSKEGDHFGTVEITSDDANQTQFIVPLKGKGTTITHQKDTFHQNDYPMLDVMFVVDCSGSMSAEQDKVARNLKVFTQMAVKWNADFNLGLNSCDISSAKNHKGLLHGSPRVLNNKVLSEQDLIDKFSQRVTFPDGCDGGSQEAGLEAAFLGLSAPLILNENAGFLRDEAKLVVIWISDEEDQSPGDLPFYIDFMRNIKGMRNVNMLEGYAIVGDKKVGCTGGSGGEGDGAEHGDRYIAVAEACNPHKGESFYSICQDDYTPVFNHMATNMFALRNQFFLSRLADPATISVKVDGAPSGNWQYDDVGNSIVFPEDQPPHPGATIEVEYDTVCLH